MKSISVSCAYKTWLMGTLAGTAGGVAEILWVGFYGAISENDTTEIARSIASVVGVILPISPFLGAPIASGIAIHMFAAFALGIALAFAWRALSLRNLVGKNEYWLIPAALVIIWVLNFFVFLPVISAHFPELHRSFTEILPYSASLISKLLFGLATAAILTLAREDRAQPIFIRI